MKKMIVLLAVILTVTGCKKKEALVPVRVQVRDFTISQEDFLQKSESAGTYTGVKAITLAFYSGTTEVYKTVQLRDDHTTYTDFGSFNLSLPMGSYTMVVLGYGGNGNELALNSLTEAVFTGEHVRETFVATQEVEVSSTTPLNLSATLSRVVAKVRLQSTDVRPANIDSLRISFAHGGKGVNPLTGLASSNSGLVNSVAGTNNSDGTTLGTSYLFLATDQQTMDVTIDALNHDGAVVFHKVVEDVPLQRNKVTVMSGQMFTSSSTAAFNLDVTFLADTSFVPF